MSAPKSKAKQQQLARKRQRKEATRARRKENRGGFWDVDFCDSLDFPGPLGGVKMSRVLGDFVEPFKGDVQTIDDFRRLLTLGQGAWNAALLDKPQREKVIARSISSVFSIFNIKGRRLARKLIDSLIVRKEQHFAEYLRPILGFEVQDTGTDWHLQVISALV